MRSKIATLLIAGLLAFTVMNTVAADANQYARRGSVPEKLAAYHIKVNDIVNQHVYGLTSYFDENQTITQETQQIFLSPANGDTAICFDEEILNLSASCLYEKINQEYQLVQEALSGVGNVLPDQISDLSGGNLNTQSQGLEATETFAIQELQNSAELMEQSIEFYRQLLFAYPIHKQYEQTIDHLEEYRSNLKTFKNQIERYPSKFHNASTTQCT